MPDTLPARATFRGLVPLLILAIGGCNDSVTGNGPEAQLVIASGNGQDGAIGEELLDPLVVRALAADGTPEAEVVVTWLAEDGSVTDQGPTDAEGYAFATWRLGDQAGVQSATAAIVGADPVTFTATASPWFFRFDYEGARSGTFLATDRVEFDEDGGFASSGSFVLATVHQPEDDEEDAWWTVAGFHATDFPTGDIGLFDADGAPVPDSPYDLFETAFGLIDFDVALVDGRIENTPSTVLHDIVAGTLTLTQTTDSVLAGTFEGTAQNIDEPADTVLVTNGRFRAPVVDDPAWDGSVGLEYGAGILQPPAGRRR